MKTCAKCKETKPLEEFSQSKQAKDGKQPRCKSCNRIDAQERKHKQKLLNGPPREGFRMPDEIRNLSRARDQSAAGKARLAEAETKAQEAYDALQEAKSALQQDEIALRGAIAEALDAGYSEKTIDVVLKYTHSKEES